MEADTMKPTLSLPAAPLIAHIDARRIAAPHETLGVDRSTVENWRLGKRQWITERRADRYAVALGVHPCEVWPEWWELPTSEDVAHADRDRRRERRRQQRQQAKAAS